MSDYTDWTVEHYMQDVKAVAEALRRLADQVERDGMPRRDLTRKDSEPDYMTAATRVLHAVSWGVANAGAERVVGSAAEVHVARACEK